MQAPRRATGVEPTTGVDAMGHGHNATSPQIKSNIIKETAAGPATHSDALGTTLGMSVSRRIRWRPYGPKRGDACCIHVTSGPKSADIEKSWQDGHRPWPMAPTERFWEPYCTNERLLVCTTGLDQPGPQWGRSWLPTRVVCTRRENLSGQPPCDRGTVHSNACVNETTNRRKGAMPE